MFSMDDSEAAPEVESDPKSSAARIVQEGKLWVAESAEPGEPLTAETVRQTQNEIRDREAFDRVLAKVPDVEPDSWDRWTSPDDGSATKKPGLIGRAS